MRRCMRCHKIMWPWQSSTRRYFHRRCYEQALRLYDDTQAQYDLRVPLYPGERYSVTVTQEELRQMRLRRQQEDEL